MRALLQVLIVDDEPLIRKGLITRLEAIRPGMEIREAACGERALEALDAWRAQLVIADIQMPGMDGLELIATVKARWPDMQFIILTGYAEFAYARRAIQLGVQDYLLKPISTRELSDTLERVTQRISSELSAKSSGAELTHLKSRLDGIHLQQSFYRLIGAAGLQPDEAAELQKQIFPRQREPLMLAILYVSGFAPRREAGAAYSLADEAAALLPDGPEHGAPYLLPHYMNTSRMLYLAFPCRGADGRQEAEAVLARLLERLGERGVQATAGVSDPKYVLSRDDSSAATAALQRRLLYGAGKVYACGAASSVETSQQLSQDLADFHTAISMNDSASAEATLARIFSPEHVPNAPRNYLWTAYLHVMSTLSLNVGLQSPNPDASPLDGFDTREEFLQYLRMLLHSVVAPRSSPEAKRNERIGHAIEYIRRHFNENLTLNSLSYQYALSPNYFSTVFKETTGMGVVNYLTGVRMENACYMLAHTDLSVGSIARQVGYADAQYFFQVFKKNVGVTPVQYRKQSGDEAGE